MLELHRWETRAVLEETGAGLAAQATDGHTLLMISIAHAVNPALYPRLPYAEGDFVPVGPVAIVPNILVVPASRPWRSVADLVADARRRPGRLAYASAGSGTSIHLAGALFADLAGIELEHVPYRGSAPAVTDLVAGRVDAMFDSVMRAAQPRTVEETWRKVGELLDIVSPRECGNYLANSGYVSI
jgi:tripartite-type tricarboxylate transporter receptor subunit TctC